MSQVRKTLNITETAHLLEISRHSIKRMMKMGLKGKIYKEGESYRFLKHEVLRFKKDILDRYRSVGGEIKPGGVRYYFSAKQVGIKSTIAAKYDVDPKIRKRVDNGVVKYHWEDATEN